MNVEHIDYLTKLMVDPTPPQALPQLHHCPLGVLRLIYTAHAHL